MNRVPTRMLQVPRVTHLVEAGSVVDIGKPYQPEDTPDIEARPAVIRARPIASVIEGSPS